MSTNDLAQPHFLDQHDALDPVLDELGSILLDCLRLNPSNAKATHHILDAINARVLEIGMTERWPCRTEQLLQPWQEMLATSLLIAPAGDRVTIQTIAVACGITAAQFSRAFKAQFGQSPQQWRLAAAIERSKILMRETTLSLTNIAVECGFAEQSHFNHTFLKRVGVCPGNWRKQLSGAALSAPIFDDETV